ncbi:MAG TPA: helix-turn-helix transcriptional regulator [Gallionella sp.]|nr:helix-turn-helix transcriptional regulator [Gallionella sp.]
MAKKQKNTPLDPSQQKDWRRLERSAHEVDGGLGVSTSEPESELGKRLEYQRQAKGFTQDQLATLTKQADKDGKGLSRGVISLYELGINRPGIKEIRLLCEVLRVSPSYFIYGDDDPFDIKANSLHHGGVAESEPEFLARAVYCLRWLEPEQSIALVQIMIGMLRGERKGFDKLMEAHADRAFLDVAENLNLILNSKKKP